MDVHGRIRIDGESRRTNFVYNVPDMGAKEPSFEKAAASRKGALWCFRVLGNIEVTSTSNKAVRFSSRTCLALLAFLAIQRQREFSNEYLQSIFWPDSEGDKAAQNLRRAIADLRKVLEQNLHLGCVIETRKGHVSLNKGRIITDVEHFLDRTQIGADVEELAEAVQLYAGPLLPTLDEGWVVGHRMEVEERYGQSVYRLCGLLVEGGKAKQAINVGRAAVVAAPNREDVHIALIHAYGAAGMRVEALRQYEELERILDDTWGEIPSPEARRALESAFETVQAGKHNFPSQVTSFIGREKEIKDVLALLAKTRLLTLTGSGGCGKTRLTVEVAGKVLEINRDGAWFVEFASLTDPDLVPQTVAAVLGVTEQPGRPVKESLLRSLKTKKLVLVLDNCEHLLQACSELVTDILRECPGVRLLASSREGLRVAGETIYRVPSLSLPDPELPQTPESLVQFESVRLFVERAASVQTAFALTEHNAHALASVCHRLDGIPLAIELASARVGSMTVEELDERLDERFALLTGGSRTALPRQQTLRSLIDWSYDLLSGAEKALFCRLAVFSGGWTLASAEEVSAGGQARKYEVLDLLTSLCDKNLVVADQVEGHTRYRILETIRQYALDRLLESGEDEACRNRHFEHFLTLAEEAERHLTGPDQQQWLKRLGVEYDNFRAGFEWCSRVGGNHGAGLRLAGALVRLWRSRGHITEGLARLTGLLAEDQGDQITIVRAKALVAAGDLARLQCDFAGVRKLTGQALVIYRRFDDRIGIAISLASLGIAAFEQCDYVSARAFHEESLTVGRELGDQVRIAAALGNLGCVARAQGDYLFARELHEECLEVSREIGNLFGAACATVNLGFDSRDQGDYSTALSRFSEGLAILQVLRDRVLIGDSLLGVASVEATLSRPHRAARLWGAAEQLREAVGIELTPHELAEVEPQVTAARSAMGDDGAFDRAWRAGTAMSMDEAIELAMAIDNADL